LAATECLAHGHAVAAQCELAGQHHAVHVALFSQQDVAVKVDVTQQLQAGIGQRSLGDTGAGRKGAQRTPQRAAVRAGHHRSMGLIKGHIKAGEFAARKYRGRRWVEI
jgi:hypothetical protein